MWRTLGILFLHMIAAQKYFYAPGVKLQAFASGGFKVSIEDSPGITLFAFHGNLNKPLRDLQAGEWNRDILKSRHGRWTFEEFDVQLKLGDVIYYWIFVEVDGLGYTKTNQYWIVSEYDRSENRIPSHQPTGLFEVPDAKLEALHPKGLRVSIPDEPGIELFAFHGKVNSPLDHDLEAGTMSRDILRSRNGLWVYEDRNARIRDGDIIYYWIYVIVDGLGYQKLNQKWIVTGAGDSYTTESVTWSVTPPVTHQTTNKEPAGEDIFQLDFKLREGMELTVVVKDGKLLLKKPLPSQLAFDNADSVKIGSCKAVHICVPSVEITQPK